MQRRSSLVVYELGLCVAFEMFYYQVLYVNHDHYMCLILTILVGFAVKNYYHNFTLQQAPIYSRQSYSYMASCARREKPT